LQAQCRPGAVIRANRPNGASRRIPTKIIATVARPFHHPTARHSPGPARPQTAGTYILIPSQTSSAVQLRNLRPVLILGIVLCTRCAAEEKKYIPLINPKATPAAVNLYDFLQDIQGRFTLSGQHNFVGKGSAFTEQLEALTGKSPVVWGSDFSFTVKGDDAMHFQHAGPANLPTIDVERVRAIMAERKKNGQQGPPPLSAYPKPEFLDITLAQAREKTIAEIKARHAKGHVITLMWHECFPTDGTPCLGESVWAEGHLPTDEQWNALLTDGTALNEAWKKSVDEVAGYLDELQKANIPVLWRPYHEMNGEWFWWGHKKGEKGFKRLWIMMYDRFTKVHGLNNLIWVWDANAPRGVPGERGIPYEDCFPGAGYVDVLASDIYRNDYKPSHYDQLLALGQGKPVALGEVGELPSLDVLQQQPRWTWFMSWGWILFLANEPDRIKAIYNCERVLTLDRISVDQNGKYTVK
jgi:mannan endo-1,4-beta-mannosidase